MHRVSISVSRTHVANVDRNVCHRVCVCVCLCGRRSYWHMAANVVCFRWLFIAVMHHTNYIDSDKYLSIEYQMGAQFTITHKTFKFNRAKYSQPQQRRTLARCGRMISLSRHKYTRHSKKKIEVEQKVKSTMRLASGNWIEPLHQERIRIKWSKQRTTKKRYI